MAKILTVDDQLTIRELVSAVLVNQGHEVDTAEDGMAALKLLESSHDYDLIISDVNMPNLNGISLVSKIRQIDDLKYVPILMLTTESGQDIKNTARTCGASGWLTKPFDSHRLSGAVKKLLARMAHS